MNIDLITEFDFFEDFRRQVRREVNLPFPIKKKTVGIAVSVV